MPGKPLGQKVHDLRVKIGISQSELGQRVSMNQSQICKIEQSKRKVSAIEAVKLATALGTALPEFLDD